MARKVVVLYHLKEEKNDNELINSINSSYYLNDYNHLEDFHHLYLNHSYEMDLDYDDVVVQLNVECLQV